MTGAEVLTLALALPGAEQKSHFGKTDVRVKGRIFVSFPGEARAVVKLTPAQQEMMAAAEPAVFQPIPGGWGRKGWTGLALAHAGQATVRSALTTAWRNVAPRSLLKQA